MSEEKKELSLEEAFGKLDQIVKKLESGELSLEATFQEYQTGMNLLRECTEKIDVVEKKVLTLDKEGTLHEFQ